MTQPPEYNVTTPPRVWFETDGEPDREARSWDPDRALYGLPVEVEPVARWLERGLHADHREEGDAVPEVHSIEVVGVAVRAVREAILKASERDGESQTTRAMHARLDRGFARLALAVLDSRSADARGLLRDVSHDLRSPLNSILFLADALASGHSGELNPVQRRQVGVLYSAAVSLVGLVNDLIDVTRLGDAATIEVAIEPFSVESVLQQVDQLVGPLAGHGSVDLAFRLETLGPRMGDRRILTRILINLVSNAVQACGGDGGRVEVRVTESDGDLRVTVSDSGSEADIAGIAARLGDASLPGLEDRGRGWTHGLGLAICARLVRAANGSVDVGATDRGGCMFTLRLPFPRA